jgi:hypothetical protein
MSPFDDTIWIDADAVPIRGLDTMFRELESGSWLTLETYVTELHARQVYLKIVNLLEGEIPPQYPQAARINSGVFAFRRDDDWVRGWWRLCEQIMHDHRAAGACSLRDQHALVALLCQSKPSFPLPRILEERGLNWAANGCPIQRSHERKNYPWESHECLSMLREDHPGVSVVHWLGAPKPGTIR